MSLMTFSNSFIQGKMATEKEPPPLRIQTFLLFFKKIPPLLASLPHLHSIFHFRTGCHFILKLQISFLSTVSPHLAN